jgi:hypothetical protein
MVERHKFSNSVNMSVPFHDPAEEEAVDTHWTEIGGVPETVLPLPEIALRPFSP